MGQSLDDFLKEWRSEDEYIIAHTSGSTGTPKKIMLLKADMRVSARATNAFFGIKSGDVIASPLSVDYIAGKMMVVRAEESGAKLIQLPVGNNVELPENDIVFSLVPIVPTQIASLISHSEYAARIRNLLIGGAAPSVEQCKKLVDAGYNTFISYGMTETCSHVALARADAPERLFQAMPGVSFEVDNEGRLIISAPKYSFIRLHTNDVVDLISPQTFKYLGRADNIINSGGLKLIPEELERMYAPFIDKPFYVVGRTHPELGKAVCLVVEDGEAADLMQILRENLPHRVCPKIVECVSKLPRTSNGKIIRK